MTANGFLAIWSDIAPADETSYLHWLTREHVAERLGVPGFLSARVFRARIALPRYLILYSLLDPGILSSKAYLERLNSPSAWTRRIMPILSNFKRGGGTVRFHGGWGNGGLIVPLTEPELFSHEIMRSLTASDRIAAVSLLEAEHSATNFATREKSLRSRDATFERLLIIEATSDVVISETLESNQLGSVEASDRSIYELIFHAH